MLAEGLFNSVLVYCLPLYGGKCKGDMNNLQILQNKAACIVANMPLRSNRARVFEKIGRLSVHQLVFYHTAVLVFKVRQSNQPEYLASLLTRDSRNGRIMVQQLNLQLARKSFCTRGADAWNRLPRNIRTMKSVGCFKASLKTWVMENIEKFP